MGPSHWGSCLFSWEHINTNKVLERMRFVLPWPTHDCYFEYESGTQEPELCVVKGWGETPVRKHAQEILQKRCHQCSTHSPWPSFMSKYSLRHFTVCEQVALSYVSLHLTIWSSFSVSLFNLHFYFPPSFHKDETASELCNVGLVWNWTGLPLSMNKSSHKLSNQASCK